jgi:cytochrome bd-type quinol oxidase subunit 2
VLATGAIFAASNHRRFYTCISKVSLGDDTLTLFALFFRPVGGIAVKSASAFDEPVGIGGFFFGPPPIIFGVAFGNLLQGTFVFDECAFNLEQFLGSMITLLWEYSH